MTTARQAMIEHLQERVKVLEEEAAEMLASGRDRDLVQKRRCSAQFCAELQSALKQTAPGAWRGPPGAVIDDLFETLGTDRLTDAA